MFPARSRGALRGYNIDRLILDEAQYLTQAQLEAVLPTMSARPNTQSWMFGTPPTQVGDGEVVTRLRGQALSGRADRLTWLEWSGEPGCDLDDRAEWARANPALGRRISEEAIMNERAALSDEGFRRERLGIFPVDSKDRIFGAGVWESLAAGPRYDPPAATAYGVDRSPDGVLVIAAAYRDFAAATTHVEVVFVRDNADHTGAAVDWLLENTNRRVPIVIDAVSPANPAISPLQAAKRNVVQTHANEMARACVGFSDAVAAGLLSHADSVNGDLAAAVDTARRRPIGEAGAYGWDRRDPMVAVSPLVASTLAHFGAAAHGRRPRKPARVVVLR